MSEKIDLVGKTLLPELTEDEINQVSGGVWLMTRYRAWGDEAGNYVDVHDRTWD